MASKTPLLMVDNVLDTVQLYRSGTLTADSTAGGLDVRTVASYRRDRQFWQPAAAGGAHHITSDLGAGVTAITDYIFIDRGHEGLLGTTVLVQSSSNGSSWTTRATLTVPASLTVGGNPESGTMCVTEEGALYALYTQTSAFRYWRFVPPADVQCTITGLMIGQRHQLVNYSGVYDEDAGGRVQRSEESDAGYRATGTTYSFHTLEIKLATIGVSNYDNNMRDLKRLLFELNQPVAIVMNYGVNPERAWLYQYDSKVWSMPTERVYRSGRWPFREVGHLLVK